MEVTIEDFLVVKIDRIKYGNVNLTRPHLMYQIVKYLVQDNPKTPPKSTPAHPSKILHSHKHIYIYSKGKGVLEPIHFMSPL